MNEDKRMIGVKTVRVKIPLDQKDKTLAVTTKITNEIQTIKTFASDLDAGRITRSEMKERVKNLEQTNILDKTKIKMFLNLGLYLMKIKDSKLIKRCKNLQSAFEMIKNMAEMDASFVWLSEDVLEVTLYSIGLEVQSAKGLVEKELHIGGVIGYEII
jgi:predicted nucleic acid-binding protein